MGACLLGESGEYVFIEMSPRTQLEHTVTKEIADVDLVSTQLWITFRALLDELGLG